MDRLDFIKNIECNESIEYIVKEHFDEVMSLYDLIAKYDQFSIKGNINDAEISFNLIFNNESYVKKFIGIISGSAICKYGRTLICKITEHKNNILSINLKEE